ncbi:MAG TPA: XdhC family protein [Phototrophicaceae bacterium]|nr:XdhC family protein [Phototrophicaceae bacterium]
MRAVYAALLDAQEKGISAALATVVRVIGSVPRHEGSKMLVYADGKFVGTVGGGAMESRVIQEALAAMQDSKTRNCSYVLNDITAGDAGVCGGTVEVFIEPIHSPPTLLVIGGGHVGKALAQLGKWMEYRVVLCDDRAEFANPDYLSGMDEYIVCKPAEVAQHTIINQRTCIAAVTRGLPVDVHLIPALLATEAAYIGVIGSRRRWSLTTKALREQGVSEEQLKRIRAPIGLELEAETPKEIALSILAEIVMLQRGGTGKPMQWIAEADAKNEVVSTED